MKILIQKFGGTSVSTSGSRQKCLEHITNSLDEGYSLVVVVSAMGRLGDPYATDSLLSLVDTNNLSNREKDLLMSTGDLITSNVFSSLLNENKIENIVLTGGQAGIITDNNHTDARIISLQPNRILEELNKNKVVIVPGFQGITTRGEVTTLGRGGSDTTATALGVSLNAVCVDIFTDVEGIMTADPRIVENASLIKSASYNEICNLAYEGAKVIHPRAVEMAMQKNIPVRIRSTFSKNEGTLVTSMAEKNDNYNHHYRKFLTGITQTSNITQFHINYNDENKTNDDKLFEHLEANKVSIDFINVSEYKTIFTVKKEERDITENLIRSLSLNYTINNNCSKVALIGASIFGVPGVMSRIVRSLKKNNINILQSSDSHTTIWILVDSDKLFESISILHNEFNLDKAL